MLANFTVGSASAAAQPVSLPRATLRLCPACAVVSAVFTFVFALPALIWGFQPGLVRPHSRVCFVDAIHV